MLSGDEVVAIPVQDVHYVRDVKQLRGWVVNL